MRRNTGREYFDEEEENRQLNARIYEMLQKVNTQQQEFWIQ